MKKITGLCFVLFSFVYPAIAQELNCQIQINSSQIRGANPQLFQSMQRDVYEFMNNTRWTDHVFNYEERIECSIQITLTQQTGSNKFTSTIQVQSRRPVYGTNYYTTLLNYKEKNNEFIFDYTEGSPLEFNEQTHTSNLVSVLAFYAYVIIGVDYDTFAEQGGSSFYQKAMNIALKAQTDGSAGPSWQAFGDLDNRYWLIENLLNNEYASWRSAMYKYHRQGLDVMPQRVDAGRAEVAESIKLLQRVHSRKPNTLLIRLFFSAKSDELINVFSVTFPTEAAMVTNLLKELDPINAEKYDKILEN